MTNPAEPQAPQASPEARLEQATQAFGATFSALTPDLKARVAEIHETVRSEYEEAQKVSEAYDPTTMFSTRVMQWAHDELTRNPENQPVLNSFMSAAHIVDAYHECIKAQHA